MRAEQTYKQTFQLNIFLLFIFIETILYILFLYLDLNQINNHNLSSSIKLASILICFLYAFSLRKQVNDSALLLLIGALFFTFISDVFLLFTKQYEIGVLFFCLVQTLYLLYFEHKKDALLWTFVLIIICALSTLIAYYYFPILSNSCSFILFFLCLFYILMLLSNIWDSYRSRRTRKYPHYNNYSLLFWGLLLLLFCDIQVGIFNIVPSLTFLPSPLATLLLRVTAIGIWLLYLPSQIFIVTYIAANDLPRDSSPPMKSHPFC